MAISRRRAGALGAVIAAAALAAGCSTGLIYRHTTVPLDRNIERTPLAPVERSSGVKHLEFRVSVRFDSNAIGDLARKEGLKTIHYADLETFNLLGIWRQYTVHVYGE
jgi:hypothetical protein